jgi:hypothetical protein
MLRALAAEVLRVLLRLLACLGVWAWEYGTKRIKYTSTPNAILTDIPPDLAAQYG